MPEGARGPFQSAALHAAAPRNRFGPDPAERLVENVEPEAEFDHLEDRYHHPGQDDDTEHLYPALRVHKPGACHDERKQADGNIVVENLLGFLVGAVLPLPAENDYKMHQNQNIRWQ